MGRVQITEELVNEEFEEHFMNMNDVDVSRILELVVHIKEIEN